MYKARARGPPDEICPTYIDLAARQQLYFVWRSVTLVHETKQGRQGWVQDSVMHGEQPEHCKGMRSGHDA